jgi:putative oxidoreductase
MIKVIAGFYRFFIRSGIYILPLALLIIRLGWGWELFESGRGHLSDVPTMVDRFKSWGVPFPKPSVYVSACTEMIGGILWMAGLATRLISLPLIVNFCVAYWTASRDKVVHLFQQNPSVFVDDAAFPFLVSSLLLLAIGPGAASVDAILKRLVFHKQSAATPAATPGA